MKRGEQTFVTVIIHSDTYLSLPTELQEFHLRWIRVDRHMKDMETIANDLRPFLQGRVPCHLSLGLVFSTTLLE
jgi:hypothetical protein